MEKQVNKIALAMIIGVIIGVFFGIILVLVFSSDEDIIFNDFKEKTKKFKENSKYVFLDNVSGKNRDEILEYAELKGYQLYNFTDNSNNLNSNTYNTMIFKKKNIEN